MSHTKRLLSSRLITTIPSRMCLGSRLPATIIVAVSVILSLSVALLRKVSFQAETSAIGSAVVSISPANADLAIGGELITAISTSVDQPATAVASQIDLQFDRAKVSVKELIPSGGWRTVKSLETSTGILWILTTDSPGQATTAEIGRVRWQAIAEGRMAIKIGSLSQVIMLESSSSPAPQNLNIQAQTGSINIIGGLTSPVPTAVIAPAEAPTARTASNNAAVPTQIIFTPSAAIFYFHSSAPTQVAIRYGATAEMGSEISSTTSASDQLIRLPALEPSTTYYYQTAVTSSSTKSRQLGAKQSFTTPVASSGESSSSTSQIIVFPGSNSYTANLYLLVNNEQGTPVSGVKPSLSLDSPMENLVSSGFREKDGYFTASVTNNTGSLKNIPINVLVGSKKILSRTLILGEGSTKTPVINENPDRLSVQQIVEIALGGFFTLIALALVYLRLTRLK